MSRAKKDVCVVLFDVNAANKKRAIQALFKICGCKIFTQSEDLLKLILVNTEQTNNDNNYEYIYKVESGLMTYELKNIEDYIESATPITGTAGGRTDRGADWLDALKVALKSLSTDFISVRNIKCCQILFLSDFKNFPPITDGNCSEVVKLINDQKAYVYFMGPDVKMPFTIKDASYIKPAMASLKIPSPSVEQDHLAKAREIALKTDTSVICDYKVGVHLFSSFKSGGGSQPWNVPLSIGTKIEIPTSVQIYNEKNNAKIKFKEAYDDGGENKEMLWLDEEDETKQYYFVDVVGGIARHGKFILIDQESSELFKCQGPRSFNILGFTHAKNVPEYIMQGEGTYIVLPLHNQCEKNKRFDIMVDYLHEKNMYIIARRVYNRNNEPKFVVLIPKPDWTRKCFILCQLPYADGIQFDYEENECDVMEKENLNNTQEIVIEQVETYLDSLDIDKGENHNAIPLTMNMMYDLNNTKFVNKAVDKYLDKHMALDELDLDYLHLKHHNQKQIDAEDKAKDLIDEREIVVKELYGNKGVKNEDDDGDRCAFNSDDDDDDDDFDF